MKNNTDRLLYFIIYYCYCYLDLNILRKIGHITVKVCGAKDTMISYLPLYV